MSVNTEKIADGISFTALPDPRFKTAQLMVGIFLPLQPQTASAYAVLPMLLSRATAKSPDMIAMHRRLSCLYGASVTAGVQRVGDQQLLTLTVQCIDNRFALQGENLTADAAALLTEMLFCPHLSADGLFDAEDVAQEKRCLLERIAAQINDKRAYAHFKAEQLLAPNQPYGISVLGTEQTANALTRRSLTDAWQYMLKTATFHWFYAAADSGEAVKKSIAKAFDKAERQPTFTATKRVVPVDVCRRATEQMAIAQAKVTLGFSVDVANDDARTVMAVRLMNALFGGSPSSLLFRNVREKMSLCYYCRAQYDRFKGVMTVDCGVESANVQKAEEAILSQLQAVKDGAFSVEDLESARLWLKNMFLDKENVQSGMVLWHLGQSAAPLYATPAQAAELLDTITAQEVVAAAKTVQFGSAFALLGETE